VTELRDFDLPGVVVAELTPHPDDRGVVTELYRREWLPRGPEMVQANLSTSRAGVLRGVHYHRKQTDYWLLLDGIAFVGLFDLRPDSTAGREAHLRLDARAVARGLLIPPAVAHGFYAETEIRLVYLVDLAFDGSDEQGIAWDDPGLGIPWPVSDPILSERDRANPGLGRALAVARTMG
jgi:dTDP-4-dehydrorhamnose 3,5-epimerase